MDAIRNAAYVSIGRACGFAGLAVMVIMLGLSFDLALAAKAGGLISLSASGLIWLYGMRAPTRPYRRTEAWLILPTEFRPPAVVAQKLIGESLQDASFWFAKQGAAISAFLLLISAIFSIFNIPSPFALPAS